MNIMNRMRIPTSTLASHETEVIDWPALPTETEIYILPDGRIVIADLPAEFALCLPDLGLVEAGVPVGLNDYALRTAPSNKPGCSGRSG